MRKTINIIFALVLLQLIHGGSLRAQGHDDLLPLSETAWVGLITCEPSNDLYTSFSHTALHVCDTARGINLVYNYGTFDFATPHFVWKFATRTLDYCLSREPYVAFINDYTYQRRAVWEQRLKLSRQEACNLFVLLEHNYRPENRWYRYDFFRDNCATRIRDIILTSLVHRELAYPKDDCTGKSYRDIVYTTNGNRLWWRLTVDLALGARCDRDRSTFECAFLPIEMMRQFDTLTIAGTGETLTEPAVQLLEDRREPLPRTISPGLAFWLLFAVVLAVTLIGVKKGWSLRWMDFVLYLVPALLSLLALFLWFGSEHYCTRWNMNLLWASPLFLFLSPAVLVYRKKVPLAKIYRIVAFVQMAFLLATIGMLATGWPQHLNSAVLPIAMTLFARLAANLSQTTKHTTTDN